ncbi:hypothetical protein ACJJIF_01565 [Microbulbifer sp. SSSA002]|uniref:hypothetical protein n=1 Tax=Microbulbifer sp. SSSA002 TaxID=3243376 RepID=UPI00403974AE
MVLDKNKFFVLFFWLVFIETVCASTAEEDRYIAEYSLGRLIFYHDQLVSYKDGGTNPFGTDKVYFEFEKEFEKAIRHLPENIRVDFLLSVFWHLGFHSSNQVEFQKLILSDCPEAFKERLKIFIDKESHLLRNERRLSRAKSLLNGLITLEENIKNK